jgi:asparagine synthase (glutamine-hydrolysing)
MIDSMEKRGPDGDGEWTNGWVALGHRRLSIIDLSDAGAQPMTDPALGVTVVFNGCIYNYKELRRELEPDYTFHSTSDTEIILKAYSRWGEDFVDHLRGMFAIVIVDDRKRQVVLARDQLGIKPLYLAESNGRIRFASTLPALIRSGGIDTSINASALHQYLKWHSIVPAPQTILSGVRKLPAASIRVIGKDGRDRERVYWRPEYVRDPARAGWSAGDWQDAISRALEEAVQQQMVADVPVGVLLSGGLDSSVLVALLAQSGQERLSTFSIGFEDAGGETGDEFPYSDIVAETFGTDHHRLKVSVGDFAPALGDAVAAMTEPMSTHDVAAFYLLSKEVSEHVKVVQSGQGADEIFAGYGYHQPAAGASRGDALRVFRDAFVDPLTDEESILCDDWAATLDTSEDTLAHHLASPGAETALDAVLRLDTHLLMVDDPVKRVDSMTMAWGLEARVPFLDHHLVELVASCPPELKSELGGKGVLKRIGRSLIPSSVIDRPKGYFPVPTLRHLDEPFLGIVKEALLSPEARSRSLFRTDRLEGLLKEPNSRRTPVGGNTLWNLAVLEMWLQTHTA